MATEYNTNGNTTTTPSNLETLQQWMARTGRPSWEYEGNLQAGTNYLNAVAASDVLNNYNTNPLGSVTLPQSMEVASNLSQVGALTGQNIGDIGRTSKQYQDLIQSRLSGSDENSRYLQQQRNRNMADVGRAYSGRKVAGGATLASQNEARQVADASINQQMQNNQKDNMNLLRQERNRNQQATSQAVASGNQMFLSSNMPTEISQGNTVICTEMHRQGIIDDETYKHDTRIGKIILENFPHVIGGYHFWAIPVVSLMKKSKIFTYFVSTFAKPWALGMNANNSMIWQFYSLILFLVGAPICHVIGLATSKKEVANG